MAPNSELVVMPKGASSGNSEVRVADYELRKGACLWQAKTSRRSNTSAREQNRCSTKSGCCSLELSCVPGFDEISHRVWGI